ncbi:MAG: nicotinate-nucleotide adenylyltransferase [Bacteroidaceae bacterium]|jgi:nicotinate-nucleotide adenylyltransferase|nr:nicotinate-nucleotide adenylyltransferase [Bacteroidaceae bacterium]
MAKTRVAVFGGSFDPIHNGHLALAAEVLSRGLAAEVWFMVTPQNPHKQGCTLSDEQLRLRMVQLAIEGKEGVVACDFEFGLPRPSYTLNTLNALDAAFPEKEFSLLIGADNWEKFDRWYKGDEILSRYAVIVYPRGDEARPQLPEGVHWLPAKLYDVSSTMVRAAVSAGEDITTMVPFAVAEFIKEKGLYEK